MNQNNLHYTYFQVERLKNVVGIGRSSAYQVITSPGEVIGELGPVTDPHAIQAMNDPRFSSKPRLFVNSWLKRSLTALGL
jgi:hypothetical protein